MANFKEVFEHTLVNEGGFVPHKNERDTGGLTFGGIAEKHNPDWEGWGFVKRGDLKVAEKLVWSYAKENYWDPLRLDEVTSDLVAYNIFDFGYNAGPERAARFAQRVVGVKPDSVIGPVSLEAINGFSRERFVSDYFALKMKRYHLIVLLKPSQKIHLYNWTSRSLAVFMGMNVQEFFKESRRRK